MQGLLILGLKKIFQSFMIAVPIGFSGKPYNHFYSICIW
nr:MAG TPA: hypothetical protein [Caudoviricetes sp.]